jgi:serine acetyltransferase
MAGYSARQSSFTTGDTILAAHSNDEFNQVLAAFHATTGHSHDGTAGEGGPISTLRDADSNNKILVDSTNNHLEFYVEVSSSAVEQIKIQDGAIVPVTDNDIDLGTSSLEFKDAFFDGTVTTDGLTVSGTPSFAAGTIGIAGLDIDGGTDIGAAIVDADLLIIDDGAGGTNRKTAASRIKTYVGAESGAFDIANLDIDGGTDIGADLADADLLVVDDGAGGTNRKMAASRLQTYIEGKISGDITISSGTAAIGSGVIVNADINSSAAIADSKLATISTADKVSGAAVQIDGATDGTAITIADSDKFLIDDGGTTKYVNASQINAYTSAAVALDDISTGDAAATLATSAGNITIDAQGSDTDIILKGTDGGVDTTFLTIDGSAAGAASFNSDVTVGALFKMPDVTSAKILVADGTSYEEVAVSGDVSIASNGAVTIAASAVENSMLAGSIEDSKLNTITTAGKVDIGALEIDGATDIGADLADADLLIVDDGANGTERKTAMSRVQTYIEGKISGDITISSGTAAIGAGVIVNADINSSAAIADSKLDTISTANKVSLAALDIDGGTDIGEAIVDADLFIVDNGAGGTNRKVAASRLVTYVDANSSAASVGKAIAMAIVFG